MSRRDALKDHRVHREWFSANQVVMATLKLHGFLDGESHD